MARASTGRRSRAPVCRTGDHAVGTAFLRVLPADARRAAKARAYFRDRHVC